MRVAGGRTFQAGVTTSAKPRWERMAEKQQESQLGWCEQVWELEANASRAGAVSGGGWGGDAMVAAFVFLSQFTLSERDLIGGFEQRNGETAQAAVWRGDCWQEGGGGS